MTLRGGRPPCALPGAVYNPPFIWSKHRIRRVFLYLVSALSLVAALGSSREAYEWWDANVSLPVGTGIRHQARDQLLNGCFNLIIAAALMRFDRRRVKAEQGLVWSRTANDWLAHPLFSAAGRVRWSVSFWHTATILLTVALLCQAPLGFYDAAEAIISPPSSLPGTPADSWIANLIGALVFAAIGTCLFAYDRHRLRREWQEDRAIAGHCTECGYDLRASGDRCPECGLPIGRAAVLTDERPGTRNAPVGTSRSA